MKVLFVLLVFVVIAVAANDIQKINSGENDDDFSLARKKKSKFPFHFLGYGFGIHALGVLYWLKVKAIVVSFIVGTAIVWGFRYFTHHFKTCPEVMHEGPIIPYEHGWHGGSDHISYSSPHDIDHISYSSPHDIVDHDPYGGYSSHEVSDGPGPYHRSTTKGRQATAEEQVSDIVFTFLGVGSNACRKRFLCEMEFRANEHPLTQMAFRVIGRGVFFKYVRKPEEKPVPRRFQDCGQIHSECKFIEENIKEDETNVVEDGDALNEASQAENYEISQTDAPSTVKPTKLRSQRKKAKTTKATSIPDTILRSRV